MEGARKKRERAKEDGRKCERRERIRGENFEDI
jgi:hypothetical protein